MGKSKKGGVFGYLRGRVGDVSYSILSAKRSASGKKEQIVRILPDSVENPNSVGQILQRMKVKPAAKFYAALETILSNAFEGVAYGEASRRYFMKKAMEIVGGPYIPKGVDRFIPAEYLMSEGSLNSFPLVRSQASDNLLHTTLNVVSGGGGTYTQQVLADALGVSIDTQISIIIVNNENGIFVPHFAGFDQRITIADIPTAALEVSAGASSGNAAINVANLGISGLTMTNWVAACVILSIQDASGTWLRRTQNMVLNTTMYADLYNEDAQNAAIASYQDISANNALTNPWYLNLGMNQAFNGSILVGIPSPIGLSADNPFARNCAMGETVERGDGYLTVSRNVFATDTTDNGLIVIVDGGVAKTDPALTVAAYRTALGENAYPVKTWLNSYAAQAGLTWQGEGSGNRSLFIRRVAGVTGVLLVVDNDGKVVLNNANYKDSCVVAFVNDDIKIAEDFQSEGAAICTDEKMQECIASWGSVVLNYAYGSGGSPTIINYGGVAYSFTPGEMDSDPSVNVFE